MAHRVLPSGQSKRTPHPSPRLIIQGFFLSSRELSAQKDVDDAGAGIVIRQNIVFGKVHSFPSPSTSAAVPPVTSCSFRDGKNASGRW